MRGLGEHPSQYPLAPVAALEVCREWGLCVEDRLPPGSPVVTFHVSPTFANSYRREVADVLLAAIARCWRSLGGFDERLFVRRLPQEPAHPAVIVGVTLGRVAQEAVGSDPHGWRRADHSAWSAQLMHLSYWEEELRKTGRQSPAELDAGVVLLALTGPTWPWSR